MCGPVESRGPSVRASVWVHSRWCGAAALPPENLSLTFLINNKKTPRIMVLRESFVSANLTADCTITCFHFISSIISASLPSSSLPIAFLLFLYKRSHCWRFRRKDKEDGYHLPIVLHTSSN
jgi:hypothetical protein